MQQRINAIQKVIKASIRLQSKNVLLSDCVELLKEIEGEAIAFFEKQNQAVWFINNRDKDGNELIRELVVDFDKKIEQITKAEKLIHQQQNEPKIKKNAIAREEIFRIYWLHEDKICQASRKISEIQNVLKKLNEK